MRDLTLFSLGKNKYGIWQDEAPTVKDIAAIHWLPPVPRHIAGLFILDHRSLTLFDLAACVGLSPITREKQSYPVLFLEHEKNISGFMIDFVIGRFAIPPEAVYPMPDFLQTPLMDTCAVYNSEPIPVINITELFKSVQKAGFEPPVAELRISGVKPQKTSSVKTVRVFESGGETFAVPGSCIEKAAVKPGRVSKLPLIPPYAGGITFYNENLVSLIHMSNRLQLAEEGTPELMLVADIGDQTFGLLVDSDRGRWPDKDFKPKSLPPLAQSDWIQDAVLQGNEIIPIIEAVGLMSDQSDGLAGTPFPQRYTPGSHFKSIFGREDVKVVEFSLLGIRHALPESEVADQFRVKPYRPLPQVLSIVAGVAEHSGDLLPVLDLAACFGRRSPVTPDWQMLLVKNGDFRALVLAEAVFSERLLPVMTQRGLPFEEPHSLVYGCYPDEARVRLILNVEALAVHFDKTLFKEFFTTLSKQMPLDPMEIGPEPEETGLSGPLEEPVKPAEPEISEKQIVETGLAVSQAGVSEEIVSEPEPDATEVGRPAQQAKEQLEEGIEPVEFTEAEELVEPEAPPASIAFTAAEETEEAEEAEEKREIKETAEIAPPDIAAAAADSEEIFAAEEKTDFQETQIIAETKTEENSVADWEEFEPEPGPEETGLSGPLEEPGKLAELEIPEKQMVETELVVSQAGVSEELVPEPEPDATEVGPPVQQAKEQLAEGIEPVEFAETEELFEPEETALSGPLEEPVERAEPEISEKQMVEAGLEVSRAGVSEELVPEPEPDATDMGRSVQQAKEQLVEGIEPVEFTEIAELFEPEAPPTYTVLAPAGETVRPPAGAADEYFEAEAHKKPKRRFAVAVLVALLLAGFLTVTLYSSGIFETWMVDNENENPGALVTATQPSPAKPKTSPPPESEKPPAVSTGLKLTEVQKESTETPAAWAKPEPSLAKHLEPPTPKTAAAVPAGSKIDEIEGVYSGVPAALAKPEPSLAKHLDPPTPKTVAAVPAGSKIDEIEGVYSGEPAALAKPEPAPAKHLEPPTTKTAPAVPSGSEVAEVEEINSREPAAWAKLEPSLAKHLEPPTPKMAPAVPSGSEVAEVEEINSREPTAWAKLEPSPAKHLEPPTPKTAPAVPSGPEVAEDAEVKSGESAADRKPGFVPATALKQAGPRMSSPESPDLKTHRVKEGDTLWDISKRYTGTGFNYPNMAKENKISNPDLIFPNQKVRVRKKYESERE